MKHTKLGMFLLLTGLLLTAPSIAQESTDSELFKTLKTNDSLLFHVGFNHCDMSQFEKLLNNDLEFYHDKGGPIDTKEQFINVFKNGICKSDDFVSRRELIEGSLQVFPLYNNGELYAAIQHGEHSFYETPKGKTEAFGSIAKFTHLWTKTALGWQLTRALSYDHKTKDPNLKIASEITISDALLTTYCGNYQSHNTGTVSLSKKDGILFMDAGTMQTLLYPESETVFFHKQAPLTFEFVKDAAGNVLKFIVRENGNIVEEVIRIAQ